MAWRGKKLHRRLKQTGKKKAGQKNLWIRVAGIEIIADTERQCAGKGLALHLCFKRRREFLVPLEVYLLKEPLLC